MAKAVVNGATLSCTQSSVPDSGSLIVLPARKCKSGGKPVGLITDSIPVTNIVPFGTCNIIAGGNPGPCVPAVAAPWTPGATMVKSESTPLLADSDTAICSIGGSITISDAGQTEVDIT